MFNWFYELLITNCYMFQYALFYLSQYQIKLLNQILKKVWYTKDTKKYKTKPKIISLPLHVMNKYLFIFKLKHI